MAILLPVRVAVKIDNISMPSVLEGRDISRELWREYEWLTPYGVCIYRIEKPVDLYWAPGHTTHRIVDSDHVAHVCPAPPIAVIRWESKDVEKPVKF